MPTTTHRKIWTSWIRRRWLGGPPVPIPNTEVKHPYAESTWLETAREVRELPVLSVRESGRFFHLHLKNLKNLSFFLMKENFLLKNYCKTLNHVLYSIRRFTICPAERQRKRGHSIDSSGESGNLWYLFRIIILFILRRSFS